MLKGGDGKTLLRNWQEEREVYDLDHLFTKEGHQGLLTTNFGAKVSDVTEVRENYTPPNIRSMSQGKRSALLEQALFKRVTEELVEDMGPNYSKEFPKQSVTHEHYNVEDFKPLQKEVTRPHNANTEMPFSYWTEHVNTSHGVSQVKTFDTPFRKNAKFSTPIDEAFDDPKPYEVENYPHQAQDGCN